MPQTFPRQHVAFQIAGYNEAAKRAGELQNSLHGLVSQVHETPEMKALALQAAEAIDQMRAIAKARASDLYKTPSPAVTGSDEERAA